MTGSRYDKMALGTTYINKLAAHSDNPFAKAKEEMMRSGQAVFVAAYNQEKKQEKKERKQLNNLK